jgi:hypothetical protein
MRIFLVLLALASGSAAANEWVLLVEQELSWSVRPGSVRDVGKYRRAWLLLDRDNPAPSGTLSSVALYEFDCDNERTRWLTVIHYAGSGGRGQVLDTDNEISEWAYTAPGTVFESVSNYICRLTLTR